MSNDQDPASEYEAPVDDEARRRAIANYEAAREERADRYRQYAANAEQRAAQASDRAAEMQRYIPVGQPVLVGHHSERRHRRDLARIDAAYGTAVAEGQKADYWRRRAEAVEHDTSIRGADPAAVAKLRAKLAALEEQRERRKAINARLRKGAALADLDLTDAERADLETIRRFQPYYGKGIAAGTIFPPYALSNLGSEIRRVKERIASLERTTGGTISETTQQRDEGGPWH